MSSHRELLGITALTTNGEHRQVRSLGQEQAMPLLQQTSSGENMPLLKKGPWTAEEDALLLAYVNQHGDGNWNSVQKHSGVARCGKSCRLRWTNHLRPNLKKGSLSPEEERIVIEQHAALGNRWSRIATMLPGRTDNEIKNFWNTRKKRHLRAGWALYPPDVKPVTRSHAHQHSPEEFVPENGTTLTYIGDGDLMSSPDCSKSSLSKQVGALGEATCPTFSGTMTRSDHLNSFSLTTPSCVPKHHVYEESLHGFKRTREEHCNLTMRNTTGWPIHGFSDNGLCLQARCLYDCNLARSEAVYQRFPFEPEPPDAKLNLSSTSASLFAGSDHGASKQVAAPASNHFSMARPDNYLQCLELELPSVQLAESADSSSTLSSPFSLSQTLHLSEVDSIGSSSNGSLQRNSGNLMDVLLQHHPGSSVDQGPAHAMDQLAMFTSSTKGAAASGSSWPENKDPLYFLGGRSLTLLNDELSENSSANTGEGSLFPPLSAGGNVESEQPALACAMVKTEYEVNGGTYTDEELVTLLTFERPAGLPIAESFLDEGLVGQMNKQGEETVGHLGGLDSIFGHGVAFHLEQLGAGNGACSGWELGLCSSSWDSMPGAL